MVEWTVRLAAIPIYSHMLAYLEVEKFLHFPRCQKAGVCSFEHYQSLPGFLSYQKSCISCNLVPLSGLAFGCIWLLSVIFVEVSLAWIIAGMWSVYVSGYFAEFCPSPVCLEQCKHVEFYLNASRFYVSMSESMLSWSFFSGLGLSPSSWLGFS